MSDEILRGDVDALLINPAWVDLQESTKELIRNHIKVMVGEYKIDKIRELQGEIKALTGVLAYPRMIIEDIEEEEARKKVLDEITQGMV